MKNEEDEVPDRLRALGLSMTKLRLIVVEHDVKVTNDDEICEC
jgi:hypothetical protein